MLKSIYIWELLGGFALSTLIGVLGYKQEALDWSGVLGAMATGTVIFGLGGWEWGALLIAFFISSSALSFYRGNEKRVLAEKFSKGHRRDVGQALANAGTAAAVAILSVFRPDPLWYAACIGAMAAVNADTWATELGVLSERLPRLITTWRPVDVGTSGGVTLLGTLASLGGALFIALVAGLSLLLSGTRLTSAGSFLLAGTLGGLVGGLADSFMGATVQAIYWCDTCAKETERQIHGCGAETRQVRGWRWLGNDWVNFVASVVGGLVAAGFIWLLG